MPKYQMLNELDLEELFSEKQQPKKSRTRRAFELTGAFILVYLVVFASINFNALRNNFYYWYKTEYKAQDYEELAQDPKAKQAAITEQKLQQPAGSNQPVERGIVDNHIKIDAINVDAPINWRVENEDNAVREALRKGVIHINGTALPGQRGNVFITGHSSDLPWSKGDYKTIFALLGKLVAGDTIALKYQGVEYKYKISETKVVTPETIEVMNQTDDSRLTLATCTPVGTTLRRLIVTAKQVSPDPKSNTNSNTKSEQPKLPKTR